MSSTISITYKLQGDKKSFKELANDADGLQKAFSGTAAQMEQLPKRMSGLRSMTGSLTKSLSSMAAGLVSIGALVKGLSSAVNTMKDFEKANSELAAVLGKSASEITGLTDAALELGKRTSFTAAEVTSLQTALARLGFTEGQIVAMQESVLKFAAAVGTDLASAADFSGAALRSFGLKAPSRTQASTPRAHRPPSAISCSTSPTRTASSPRASATRQPPCPRSSTRCRS